MLLNGHGEIVLKCWDDLPNHYHHVQLDEFAVMPNHVHGIIILTERAGLKPAPTKRRGLTEIVRAFKTFSSRRMNRIRYTPGIPVWQRNYYERIIRTDAELDGIREYIATNPLQWQTDSENPFCRGERPVRPNI